MQDPGQRSLLSGAAFQLRDVHGNAAEVGDVCVRLSLIWPDGGVAPRGSELPALDLSDEDVGQATDSRGRVFWQDVRICEGSGAHAGTR